MAAPIEEILPLAERDRIRAEALAGGGFYSPVLHLGTTTVFGLAAMAAGLWLLHDVRPWEVGFGVFLYLLSNAAEWRIHKGLLHKRSRLAPLLYDRHTPMHHMVFITDDMALRSREEFRLVLIPAYGIVLAFVGLLPMMAGLWLAGLHNLAAIFAVVTMFYVVSYEWLHLAWHLPPDSAIGRLGIVRALARHHAIHHDPRLMQRWNFNVTVPLWDLVRGTMVRDRDAVLKPQAR